MPTIGPEEFAARWDQEDDTGMLHQLVSSFDENGLIINTGIPTEPVDQNQPEGGQISQMAKRATQKALG